MSEEFGSVLKNFRSGALWLSFGKYSNYIGQFLVLAILARLLEPKDFGILSALVIYTGFLNLLAEGGIVNSVIRFQKLEKSELSSIFWFCQLLSLLIYLLTFWISPLVESFYGVEKLGHYLRILSISIFFIGLSTVPEGILRREMRFSKVATADGLSVIISGICSISLAYFGYGIYALIANAIIMAASKALLCYILSGWLPKVRFSWKDAYQVLSFSSYLMGFGIVNYWSRNADHVLVGRYIGIQSLGYYGQAYKLMLIPVQMVSSVINGAMIPVLSSIQDNKRKAVTFYSSCLEILSLVVFALGIFLFFHPNEVVMLVWGEKWIKSVDIFRILSLLTIIQPIVSTSGGVFISFGKGRLLFVLGLINSMVMVGGMIIGLPYGSTGVATGYVISYMVIVLPLTMYFIIRTLDLKAPYVFGLFRIPFLVLLLLSAVFFFTGYYREGITHAHSILVTVLDGFLILGVLALLYRYRYRLIIKELKRI